MMRKYILLLVVGAVSALTSKGQTKYKNIPFPTDISGVNEEFSGITAWLGRIYLLPQYGSYKETGLNGNFNIYSITADSVARVIDNRDTALSNYKTLKVLQLNQLPDSVKRYYQGFEAIMIVDGKVYLSVETEANYNYCFLLKGSIDTGKNQITIDPKNFISLKRPLPVKNAGFEALTYLPQQNKLLAIYEFNATRQHKTGYLIDTAFAAPAQAISMPYQYFRLTDLTATTDGKLYAINYHYDGDYPSYLSPIPHADEDIKDKIPALKDSLTKDINYLRTHTYAAIVSMDSYTSPHWTTLVTFNGFKNNWEGLILFNNGALMITDANRNKNLASAMAFIKF